eukprot:TRINITY_DN6369_c0_g1_i1.p1 TRINITY_DN6369_c0_g1~~TRINITY_DN6369_c0_g1_i1.p1  ORF type:complete len:351 (-),score=106.77 TRINITY_DN6369_c0_g1_i1:516-1568(-)
MARGRAGAAPANKGPVEGSEVEMGGIMLRAVKKPDGSIVYKPVSEIEKAAVNASNQKPKSDQAWLKEKQAAVVQARVKESSQSQRNTQKKNAKTYGASEIYNRRSVKQDKIHVDVSQYLADLRLEEAQARRAQKDTKKPEEYRFIKEALDAEEAKYQQKVVKARETEYARTRKRMGVRGAKDGGESSDEEDNKQLSEEDFRKLCQARNESANKELADSNIKLITPVTPAAEAKKQTQKLRAQQVDRDSRSSRQEYVPPATTGYVDPRSFAAQEQAAAEAHKWQSLKEESEVYAQERERGGITEPRPKGKGGGSRNRNRRSDSKGKGGKGKGNKQSCSGKGGGRGNQSKGP